jgi:hypothetical protein
MNKFNLKKLLKHTVGMIEELSINSPCYETGFELNLLAPEQIWSVDKLIHVL